ncbi:MAG TPA: preprotein translocase subunit SecA [bacterium]|nr:preprotein translocase subunit SecA [bacterium]
MKLLEKVFGSRENRTFRRYRSEIDAINAEFERLGSVSDEELQGRTAEFRRRLDEGESLDDLLVEAFATVKETCRRLCGKSWDVVGQQVAWEMVPYDVQLVGGMVLHSGRIAEMATGEGKTLVASMPMYLNALDGKGAHLVTVNDYLARRDAEWMGRIYTFLGLTFGVIQQGMTPEQRRAAYACDITYGTNNEFGFDYLRDNMAVRAEDRVQRPHNYAIVDEVDSVLIDEARTPLIISGPVESDTNRFDELKAPVQRLFARQRDLVNTKVTDAEKLLKRAEEEKDDEARYEAGRQLLLVQRGAPRNRRFMKLLAETGVKKLIQQVEADYMRDKRLHELDEELYYLIDERRHNCDLSEMGRQFLAPKNPEHFVLPDLADELTRVDGEPDLSEEERVAEREKVHRVFDERAERIQNLSQLLRAYSLYEKDVNYVVEDGKVVIVDEFTGRMMPGRRFSDGLHQALEAKESVKIERDNQTLATITLQNYFRMYTKLAGMTGTAETEETEFVQIYDLDVVVIPTNKPIVRDDKEDQLFRTKREKFNAVLEEIREVNAAGRPILVGTTSVETSELISRMLKRAKIPHSVLNAKYHQKEAEIIIKAGLSGAVTIATNMAGRGTDIKLGKGVADAGGLHIVGTERHEARRIDRQLRGRAGRQGDPGSSTFYLSLEDDLMRLFQSDRVAGIMDKLGVEDGEVIEHRFMTRAIEKAQKRVEEQNFGIRKHLLEYDNVMNKQREIIYKRRLLSLEGEEIGDECRSLVGDIAAATVDQFTVEADSEYADDWDWSGLRLELGRRLGVDVDFESLAREGQKPEQLRETAAESVLTRYREREEHVGADLFRQFERFVTLTTIDQNWRDHLYALDRLREGIGLRAYGQKDPLLEYKKEAFGAFSELMDRIDLQTAERLMKTEIRMEAPRAPQPPVGVESRPELVGATAQGPSGRAAAGPRRPPAPGPALPPGGQPATSAKTVGRNDPCPCGSGKKYKKCHGANA